MDTENTYEMIGPLLDDVLCLDSYGQMLRGHRKVGYLSSPLVLMLRDGLACG